MPMLRRLFAPRRRVTLLEPLARQAGIAPVYREHPRRAEVSHRGGSVRIEPDAGAVEVVREHVQFRIRRFDAVDPGWFVRVESDGREYEVTFREPQGDARTVLRLEARYRPGSVATEVHALTWGGQRLFWGDRRLFWGSADA